MSRPAEVNLGDPIQIDTEHAAIPAVVTLILETSCEALYIDDSGKVLAEEVQCVGAGTELTHGADFSCPIAND